MGKMANKPDPERTPDGGSGRAGTRFQGLLSVGAGNIFASTVIAGFLLGFLLDRWLDTAPIFMLACGLLGLFGGMRRAHRLMLIQSEQDEQNKK